MREHNYTRNANAKPRGKMPYKVRVLALHKDTLEKYVVDD